MAKSSPCLRHLPASAALLALSVFLGPSAYPQAARFDLTGPKIEVRVTRAGKTLPIAYVPNLQPGDKLWLHPDLPPTQSVHLLLIAAFLRGTTNPPPDPWFTKIETWNRKVTEEGVSVIVPHEAQQVILFLAPETGGDFNTLKNAVRGRPGVFVRASQDLSEAGFEQARIEKYIASMRQVPPSDPAALLEHSNLLARTLNLRPNDDCFKRPVDMQSNCLTQVGNQTLLDDGHAQNIISTLSNGSSADFITAASYTNVIGGGTYSAYVGAIVDLFRILGGLHTAQYQYIPAISAPEQESLNLRLNTPPSFRNPKSVIVIGLPSIQKAVPPPLRPADPNLISCLLKPTIVLPIDGAPLVFSTGFAHDLVLHLNTPPGTAPVKDEVVSTNDIPITPDAYQGGLVVNHTPDRVPMPQPTEAELSGTANSDAKPGSTATAPVPPSRPGEITGTISGMWGFDPFTGPTLRLQSLPGSHWQLAADDPLVAGRDSHVLIASTGTACVEGIQIDASSGSPIAAPWKPANLPNLLDIQLPLKSASPGALHLSIQQFGSATPATVAIKTFAEPATLTALLIHAGDTYATLTGRNLHEVQQVSIADSTFGVDSPETSLPQASNAASSTASSSSIEVTLPPKAPAPKLRAGEQIIARVSLKDGRHLSLPVTVAAARPVVTLLNRDLGSPANSTLQLGSNDDQAANQRLTFSLKSTTPFPRNGKIEIANADESLRTSLTVAAGTLVLQNPHTLLGTLDPLKLFGTSVFGPLRLRAVDPDGTEGAWLPLTTVVRLPTLTSLQCPPDPAAPCTLSGSDLYLLETVASDSAFTAPTIVPDGFVASTLSVPHPGSVPSTLSAAKPTTTTLYLHLRDDPAATDSAVLPVYPAPAAAAGIPRPAANPVATP